MRRIDYSNLQTPATINFNDRPVPGAYVAVITGVTDHEVESYLEVEWDIAEGPYKGYFKRFRDEHPDWRDPAKYRKYYTPNALHFFQRFGDAVSRSNGNYVFDGGRINADEKTLVGKKLGLVLRACEYYSNSGDLRTRLEVFKEVPVAQVPYQPAPKVLTIQEQEERKTRKQGAVTAPAYAQPPVQSVQARQSVTAQTYARQSPAQDLTYAQAQPAREAYRAQQQPAYLQPTLTQFVDVSGDASEMPFM